jgi:hypothetical protein
MIKIIKITKTFFSTDGSIIAASKPTVGSDSLFLKKEYIIISL